jgi:DnaK suppressor protein
VSAPSISPKSSAPLKQKKGVKDSSKSVPAPDMSSPLFEDVHGKRVPGLDRIITAAPVPVSAPPKRRSSKEKSSAPLHGSPAKYIPPPKSVNPVRDDLKDQAPIGLTAPALPKSGKVNVRYSDGDLTMFKLHIESIRKKEYEEYLILREQLDDVTSSELADENSSYSMHMAEQGTDAQEKEKIYAQVQRKIEYVKKLDEALQRIKDKTYGICKMCGCLINKERLLMVPITTLSVSYKIHAKCPDDGVDRITARTK